MPAITAGQSVGEGGGGRTGPRSLHIGIPRTRGACRHHRPTDRPPAQRSAAAKIELEVGRSLGRSVGQFAEIGTEFVISNVLRENTTLGSNPGYGTSAILRPEIYRGFTGLL